MTRILIGKMEDINAGQVFIKHAPGHDMSIILCTLRLFPSRRKVRYSFVQIHKDTEFFPPIKNVKGGIKMTESIYDLYSWAVKNGNRVLILNEYTYSELANHAEFIV